MLNQARIVLVAGVLLAGCGSSATAPTPEPIAVTIPTIVLPTLRPAPTPDTFTGVQPPGPDFGKSTSQRQEPATLPSEAPAGTTPVAEPAPTSQAGATAAQTARATAAEAVAADSVFPVTADAADMRDLAGDGTMTSYSSKLSAAEIMDFYRKELGSGGAVEREILTVQTGDVFSMVFDQWPAANGKAVVIQGVPIAPGTMNVSIRLEEV